MRCFLTRSCPNCDCSRREVGTISHTSRQWAAQQDQLTLLLPKASYTVDQLRRGDAGVREEG